MLRIRGSAEESEPGESEAMFSDSRVWVRLRFDAKKVLEVRARARGIPSATQVALPARNNLRAVAPLPEAELLAANSRFPSCARSDEI